jgi:hypothetical protein
MREPATVGGHAITVRQSVSDPKPFQRQIGEGRRRLTDRKPRMRSALEEHDIVAEHGENAREQ